MDRYKDFSNVLDNPYKMPDMEYRGYTIISKRTEKEYAGYVEFNFYHDDYDHYTKDDRCGSGVNYIECMNQIDEIEGKNNASI